MGVATITSGVSRSITAENPTGEKGAGAAAVPGQGGDLEPSRELGKGWKVSPCAFLEPDSTYTVAEIDGPGVIRHLWFTFGHEHLRSLVLRIYWDDEPEPAVAVPFGDFFCHGWGTYAHVNSQMIAVNPNGGLNSYWEMPFRRRARITVQNLKAERVTFYYQVDYELTDVPEDQGYLHAAWRRSNPLGDPAVHTILDGVRGGGHYVGTYIAWGANSSGWWGEGEVKFYLDGDDELPTICGTGTEDYFGGAWNFDVKGEGYTTFSTPYLGMPQVLRPDGLYASQQRFGMYRWHVPDPIRFTEDIRVTVQALGWRSGHRFLPLHDDIASTALWYQRDPAGLPEPDLTADALEVL